jgi:integrase
MAWSEKLPSGRYRAVYRDAYGKRRSAGTFAHKAEATRRANAKEEDVRRSMARNPDAHRQTWGDWCTTWWPTRTVEASTEKRDRSRRDTHLMPQWENVPLGQITRHDVRAWAADLRREGLANASVQRIVHLFSASLNAAVDDEILAANPALRLKLPPAAATKDRFLEHDEYDRVIEQLPTTTDQLVTHVLTFAGLRIGELSALRWNRVRTTRGSGLVTVAASYDDETGTFKPYPKGKRTRSVPIDDWLCELLEAHRLVTKGRTNDLVFTAAKGGVPRRSNWDDVFRRAVDHASTADAPIEDVTVHTLRHTFCSWLAQNGVSLARIGQLAGHVSPLTTQRYSHLQPVDDSEVHRALGRPTVAQSAPRLPHAEPSKVSAEVNTGRSDVVGPVVCWFRTSEWHVSRHRNT